MSISLEKYMGYRMDVTKETLDKDGKMNYESFDQFTFEMTQRTILKNTQKKNGSLKN